MKIKGCSIFQFGKLKEQQYEFPEGITLIRGANESGKTTLHTALAALLFGVERGRGRAAAKDVFKAHQPWSQPELYGGSLDWEREGHQIHVVRDLAKNPPAVTITDQQGDSLRNIREAEQPLPDSLTPYLFFNTLSFKQMGGGVEAGMADELRSHIINLQGSGNESMDVAAALSQLKAKRRSFVKDFREDAEREAEALSRELAQLEEEDFEAPAQAWDDAKQVLENQDQLAEALSEAHRQDSRQLAKKKNILRELAVEDRDQFDRDRGRAARLLDQLEIYEKEYAPTSPRRWILQLVSYGSLLIMLLGLWLLLNALQFQQYLRAALAGVLLITAVFLSIRYSRKLDAMDAHRENRKQMEELLNRYVKDYTPTGSLKEARELKDYLERLSGLWEEIDSGEAKLKDQTAELVDTLSRREHLSRRLEEELNAKQQRTQWESRLRAMMDRQEQIKPLLEENARIRQEVKAIDLAHETLAGLASGVYSDFGAPLTREASAIFRQITAGRYEGVQISDKLEIYAIQAGRPLPPSALSGGTMQQLYFAFRMAMIRLIWPGEDMPLFFDDAFAFYDEERLSALLDWLHKEYTGQILIFSCQEREEKLLAAAKIPYHRIELT